MDIHVKHCAQARAIENECYVAIAGCVEFQSKQYGYSICTSGCLYPSDFAFPSNGIKAEATPNTEMTLIVDVDINLLKELRTWKCKHNETEDTICIV
jgi:predicted amidohydrolase